jgi:hypothetical protein
MEKMGQETLLVARLVGGDGDSHYQYHGGR